MDSSRSVGSPATREALYQHLRHALAQFEDSSSAEPVRAMAWAAASNALEYLNDERSLTDALAVAHRAIDLGDEEPVLMVLSAIADRLPPDGSSLLLLGDRANSAGLLEVVHAVGRALRRGDVPVPNEWPEAPLDDDRRGSSVGELLDKPADIPRAPVDAAEPLDLRQVQPISNVLRETFSDIARANATGRRITGIPTGFDGYDRLTGGLHDGELTIVAAPPGIGKTTLVLNMAANVASPQQLESARDPGERWVEPGHGVLIFSLGTSRRRIVGRMLCAEARVDFSLVRTGMLTPEDWQKLTEAAGRMAALNIWVQDEPEPSPLDIRNAAARLQADFDRFDPATGDRLQRLGLIVIDSWRRVRRRTRRKLRYLARELMVPIIATTTVHAASGDRDVCRRPQIWDLPIDDDDADNLCFVHRDSYYDPEASPDVMELIVHSQRNEAADTVRLHWEPQYLRLQNPSETEHDARRW
jgi:replicative DNA helicase